MAEDDSLPPELQAQVDAIRNEGAEPDSEPEQVAVPDPPKPLSRRAQAEQERMAQIEAATRRAEAAEKIAEELRQSRIQDAERLARMEQAIQFIGQQRQEAPPPRREEPQGPSADERIRKLQRERDAYLAEGKVAEYHDTLDQIARLHGESIAEERVKRAVAEIQARMPQQAPQKPGWVVAIEARYPEIMIHPRGTDTVAGFMNVLEGQLTPEKLDKAFQRAKAELGLGARQEDNKKVEQQRQLLAGGPTHSTPRSPGGNGKPQVKMPKGWQEAARKAGMTNDQYIQAYVEMNPQDVVRQ